MNQQKRLIINKIDDIRDELIELSHNIHKNPETSYNEYKAVGFISNFLKKHGFEVEEKYCGIDTSFKAVKKGKAEGPKIAFWQNMMHSEALAMGADIILLQHVQLEHLLDYQKY